MPKLEHIQFTKYHALGNDFIVIAGALLKRKVRASARPAVFRSASKVYLARLARSICDRHQGVGADGLLLLLPPKQKQHHIRMRVFNADGSEAEMSGNGIRCAAAYLAARSSRRNVLLIETAGGVKSVEAVLPEGKPARAAPQGGTLGRWIFRVGMGVPVTDPSQIPFKSGDFPGPVLGFPLPTLKGVVNVTVTSMGNPHCSLFVDDFDTVDWLGLGREIERHPLFPNRTNVEFVRVISRNEIEVRYWERGVGKTQSSGTGSCAAVVACILNGLTERKVRVLTLAGTLDVEWPEAGQGDRAAEISLTGPAELIAAGTYHFRKGWHLVTQAGSTSVATI
jgi:diaminopimelate epimerase